jgi:2-keto-4-pentenoate hydratase
MPDHQVDTVASTEAIARRLDEAWEQRHTIRPLSESEELTSPEVAYAIQERWTELRLERGEGVMGRKIGLTSRAMQEQMGVSEPDYGTLWTSRWYPAVGGRCEMPSEVFLQPRLEGEIAYLIGRPLSGPGVTSQQVMAATEALAVAVEVIDSRIDDWRIKLVDTIADNSSYGALTLGPWSTALRGADLRTLGMIIQQNGRPAVEGVGAAALGHPSRAVAWLVNKLSTFGVSLAPGDVVLSGSLARSLPAKQGDVFLLETHGQPPLSVTFG